MPDWKKIKAEYIAGGTSYRKLAEKYGVSFSTIRKIAAKEKWTDLRNIAGAERDTKIAESIGKNEAKTAVSINSVADALLKKIEEKIDVFTTNPNGIKQITGALKDLKEIKGLKSEADMREQEARINKLIKDAQTSDTNTEIQITISDELKNYSE